jgi:competence protein ComEA
VEVVGKGAQRVDMSLAPTVADAAGRTAREDEFAGAAWRTLMLWLCVLTVVRFGPASLGRIGSALLAPAATPTKTEYEFRVDINTADIAELRTLEGIGPTLAERIIDYRKVHGAFRRIEELTKVPGFGEKRLAQLSPRLMITQPLTRDVGK